MDIIILYDTIEEYNLSGNYCLTCGIIAGSIGSFVREVSSVHCIKA